MFSKPHFCQLSGLKGTHLHQFEAHLGTKLMTFPKMILGEDPKHVSQLNVNLSLILSLCLSPILSLSLRLEARG